MKSPLTKPECYFAALAILSISLGFEILSLILIPYLYENSSLPSQIIAIVIIVNITLGVLSIILALKVFFLKKLP